MVYRLKGGLRDGGKVPRCVDALVRGANRLEIDAQAKPQPRARSIHYLVLRANRDEQLDHPDKPYYVLQTTHRARIVHDKIQTIDAQKVFETANTWGQDGT